MKSRTTSLWGFVVPRRYFMPTQSELQPNAAPSLHESLLSQTPKGPKGGGQCRTYSSPHHSPASLASPDTPRREMTSHQSRSSFPEDASQSATIKGANGDVHIIVSHHIHPRDGLHTLYIFPLLSFAKATPWLTNTVLIPRGRSAQTLVHKMP